MCTVSFVPTQNGFILMSNRDEKTYRITIAPKVYVNHDVKLLYPKDEIAGGTWIVAKERGIYVIFLTLVFSSVFIYNFSKYS
jgi:hypothetical protein